MLSQTKISSSHLVSLYLSTELMVHIGPFVYNKKVLQTVVFDKIALLL